MSVTRVLVLWYCTSLYNAGHRDDGTVMHWSVGLIAMIGQPKSLRTFV